MFLAPVITEVIFSGIIYATHWTCVRDCRVFRLNMPLEVACPISMAAMEQFIVKAVWALLHSLPATWTVFQTLLGQKWHITLRSCPPFISWWPPGPRFAASRPRRPRGTLFRNLAWPVHAMCTDTYLFNDPVELARPEESLGPVP
jgi:hypothetical protein